MIFTTEIEELVEFLSAAFWIINREIEERLRQKNRQDL
jgi:hypothetical protein